jgi:hypothetical protein
MLAPIIAALATTALIHDCAMVARDMADLIPMGFKLLEQ